MEGRCSKLEVAGAKGALDTASADKNRSSSRRKLAKADADLHTILDHLPTPQAQCGGTLGAIA
jgi:hypothetical protein